MTRQYIGARYTIKVYENTNDPSSAEWESGVIYEPLTMVTFNYSTYLSKKEVPANIGDPAANPLYWVVTGAYNGQISVLSQRIAKFESIIRTPFMFGGVGNGIADDTQAIQSCIDSGVTVDLCGKTWRITDSLRLDNLSFVEIKNGKILHDSGQIHNSITGLDTYCIYIHDIEFDGNGWDNALPYVFPDNYNACCVLPRSSRVYFEHNKVKNYKYGVFTLGAAEHMLTNPDSMRSYDGSISFNHFTNCGAAIDTYGKSIDIGFNTFDTFTAPEYPLIQIEPADYTADVDMSDPLGEATYDSSAFNVRIHNNYFMKISTSACISVFPGSLGVTIEDNLFIDYYGGITAGGCRACLILNNIFVDQKLGTIDPVTPRCYNTPPYTIAVRQAMIKGNWFYGINTGIYVQGHYNDPTRYVQILENMFDGVNIAAVCMYIDGPYDSSFVHAIIKNNIIKNVVSHSLAFIRAITVDRGNVICTDNFIDSTDEAIGNFGTANTSMLIDRCYCTTPPTQSITRLSGYTVYNN